jgi:crotonobetainyl-CoA:carnitine CoA-transferase CaiB-like acyl-CoA transferase
MSGLLDTLRVVDLSSGPLAYCGRMLADLGADVVLVEPPGGDAARREPPLRELASGEKLSAVFAFTAAGKRSVTLDLARREGLDALARLLDLADVVITTAPPGMPQPPGPEVPGPQELAGRHPRLIIASITPYGLRGPRRGWRGGDLTAWASSGVMPAYGDPDRAPLAPRGGRALAAGALNAVMGIMLALEAREQTGQGQLLDISLQEAVLSVSLELSPALAADNGVTPKRVGKRRPTPPMGQYRTRDGAVMIVAYTPWQWTALAEWIRAETGIEEAVSDRYHGTPADRAPYAAQLDQWIEMLTSRYGKQEFAEEAQRRGVPVSPVNTLADVLHDPHLAATGGWAAVTSPGGSPVRLPAPPLSVDGVPLQAGAIPGIGEHNAEIIAGELGLGADDDAGGTGAGAA